MYRKCNTIANADINNDWFSIGFVSAAAENGLETSPRVVAREKEGALAIIVAENISPSALERRCGVPSRSIPFRSVPFRSMSFRAASVRERLPLSGLPFAIRSTDPFSVSILISFPDNHSRNVNHVPFVAVLGIRRQSDIRCRPASHS